VRPAIRAATRGSVLARRQTELVLARLRGREFVAELTAVEVQAAGDLAPDTLPEAMAGEGWFSSALERSLATGDAELAVHSAKDLPSRLAAGMGVAAYLPRADPRDAVVTADGAPWRRLPSRARVATGSPRRAAQLMSVRPDLSIVPIRGNVDTRLERLAEGAADAVVVALAGLERLGRAAGAQPLDPYRECTPAPAQGAIAVEARRGSDAWVFVESIDDPATRLCCETERAVLAHLGGGCRLPLGVLAETVAGERVRLTAAFLPGSGPGVGLRRRTSEGPAGEALQLAAEMARALR